MNKQEKKRLMRERMRIQGLTERQVRWQDKAFDIVSDMASEHGYKTAEGFLEIEDMSCTLVCIHNDTHFCEMVLCSDGKRRNHPGIYDVLYPFKIDIKAVTQVLSNPTERKDIQQVVIEGEDTKLTIKRVR